MTEYKALVVEDDPPAVEMIEEAIMALGHTHDLAGTLVEARRLIRSNGYSYVLLDIAFPTRTLRGTPRVQNAENLLDDLAEAKGPNAPPVVIMNDRIAEGRENTEHLMRLAMSLGFKGAKDLIQKPFAPDGRTLDRVIKKVLGLNGHGTPQPTALPAPAPTPRPATRRRRARPAKPCPPPEPPPALPAPDGHADTPADPPALTKVQRDVLDALARSPHQTMLQVEVAEAAGYGKHATQRCLVRLGELGLVHRPQGERRGCAITAKGCELLAATLKPAGSKPRTAEAAGR